MGTTVISSETYVPSGGGDVDFIYSTPPSGGTTRSAVELRYIYYKEYLTVRGYTISSWADVNTLHRMWLDYRLTYGDGNNIT